MSTTTHICRDVQQDPRGETWSAEMREHAGTCPACRSFLSGLLEMGRRLKGLGGASRTMPEAMRGRLLAQLESADEGSTDEAAAAAPAEVIPLRPATHRRAWAKVVLPAAMAACLVVGVGLEKAFRFGEPALPVEVDRNVGMYIEDVTHDHYLLERIGRPLEVAMTDPDELSGWLSHSLAFDFTVPVASGGLTLEGGRVWHTVGRLSALASYRTPDGQRVVLFAVPAANLDLAGAEEMDVHGHRVFRGTGWEREARVWFADDLALALVAPDGELPVDWAGMFLE